MPTPICLICFNPNPTRCLTLKTAGGAIAYFRCPACGLVFQDPNAEFNEQAIYNADYIKKRSQDPNNLTIARPRIKTAEHYYRWVDQFVTKGNLLEIGCATGLALKVAQEKGWQVYGVEVNGPAAAVACDVLKADVVRVGNLNDQMFPDGHFSLVTLFDVIEHIPHPLEFMKTLSKKIAPGGHILFVTPSVDTMSFKLLKEKWPHFVQEHLLLYSPKSIARLLSATGFKLNAHGWATKYISIGMLKTHADNHPNTRLYKPISSILGLMPAINQAVIPFNLGEMYVLAEKTA